jgi:Ca-activated chloride channel family protein
MSKTLFRKPKWETEESYKKREKVIILLTDWDANVWVDPKLASLSAKKEGIKIYTIWIGSKKWGTITYNVWPFKKQAKIPPLNDTDLKIIASNTGGKYFRAENNNIFTSIFKELSSLEKNDINIKIQKEFSEYYTTYINSLFILLFIFSYLMIWSIELRKNN